MIGIVVPTFNRQRKTRRFLESLVHQTYRDFRVYMVDSGSTDGTRDLINEHRIDVCLVPATPSHWWASATNLGVKRAIADGCDPLLMINDDAIILEDYLERFVSVFERNKLDYLANRIDFADQPGRIWALGSFSVWSSPYLFQLKFNGWWEDELPPEICKGEIYPAQATCGDGVLIRKSVFERIGFYQETYCPQVHADTEFSFRARQQGIQPHVATNVVLYNDVDNLSESMGSTSLQATELDKLKSVFFDKKSDLFLNPVIYIVARYAPWAAFLPTLSKFYLSKFYTLFGSRYASLTIQGAPRSGLARLRRRLIARLAVWAFDQEKFERGTRHHIADDFRFALDSEAKIKKALRV